MSSIHQGISTISGNERRAQLRAKIKKGELVIAPGVFEMISAKVADRMGFDALYMTGYGTVASYLGLPDAGIATYSDMVNRVTQFASITATPMLPSSAGSGRPSMRMRCRYEVRIEPRGKAGSSPGRRSRPASSRS